jgi:TPR repeat protein
LLQQPRESGDAFGGDQRRATEAFDRACRLGPQSACYRLAQLQLRDAASFQQGLALLTTGCDRGHASSCLSAALVFAPTASAHPRCEAAVPLARKACNGGTEAGCAIEDACRLDDPASRSSALARLRSACERRNALACLYWADAQSDKGAEAERLQAYGTACTHEAPGAGHIACGRLGAMAIARARTKDETDGAFRLLDHACAEASGQACCDLAEAYRAGTGVAADAGRATELRKKACDLGAQTCCPPKASK